MATIKYRPSLTAVQIQHILALAKADATPGSISLIKSLSPFLAKIEAEAISGYTVEAKTKEERLAESLGVDLAEYDTTTASVPTTATTATSKEEYWKACYEKWLSFPDQCSVEEIEAANEHRYLNDLMTPEEEKLHEEKMT